MVDQPSASILHGAHAFQPYVCWGAHSVCGSGREGGTEHRKPAEGAVERPPSPTSILNSCSNYKERTCRSRSPKLPPFPTTTPQIFLGIPRLFSRKPRNSKSCLVKHFSLSFLNSASLSVREQVCTESSPCRRHYTKELGFSFSNLPLSDETKI